MLCWLKLLFKKDNDDTLQVVRPDVIQLLNVKAC